MMWNPRKPTQKRSPAEMELQEVFELLQDVKHELREIKTVTDDLYFKVQASHSLLVVRKVGKDKLHELKDILD